MFDDDAPAHTLTAPRDAAYYREHETQFFGRVLLTDRWGLRALLEREESTSDAVEKYYPGLIAATVRALREVDAQRVVSGTIVFVNGQVQAWPAAQFATARPSDFYPTAVLPSSPGFEEVIEAEVAEHARAAEAEHVAEWTEMRSVLEIELAANPEDLLQKLRGAAKVFGGREGRVAAVDPYLAVIEQVVTPWAMANAENNELAIRLLGDVEAPAGHEANALWVLGKSFHPLPL